MPRQTPGSGSSFPRSPNHAAGTRRRRPCLSRYRIIYFFLLYTLSGGRQAQETGIVVGAAVGPATHGGAELHYPILLPDGRLDISAIKSLPHIIERIGLFDAQLKRPAGLVFQ